MSKLKSTTIIFLSLLFAGIVLAEATTVFRFVAPTRFEQKVNFNVAGKIRDYYLLEGTGQIEVQVKGPCQLKVLSRIVMPRNDDKPSYHFLGKRKGSFESFTFEHSTVVSDSTTFADSASVKISEDRNKVISVPAGDQTYLFHLRPYSKDRIYISFAHTVNVAPKPKLAAAMTPIEFSAQVALLSNEKIQTYYRIGHGEKVSLKLIGPATLKGFCRIEYDVNMLGEQKWRLQVNEDDKIKATYPFSAPKSQVTTYVEKNTLVPSRAETFFMDVPSGEHLYEFTLPENHRTVLLKFSIPKDEDERQ
jgi:hypothetical protein